MYNQEPAERGSATSVFGRRGPVLVAALLLCATAVSLLLFARERSQVHELTTSRDEMKAVVAQTRAQLDTLNAKLNAVLASQPRESETAAPARSEGRRALPRRPSPAVAARRPAPVDPRVKKLQDQLAVQEKQLASTQEEVKRAREELSGRLDSTRDELNGSIARNHDELVALQRRGERNYYEFDLSKSKQFKRTGPISLSLRKADTKHKRFDLAMMVEDAQLEKKGVNLYEPVLIYLADRPQPVELVVNQISKNQVKGYISESKYRNSDLARTAASPAPARQQELTPRP